MSINSIIYSVETPALVYEEEEILKKIKKICMESGRPSCRILFPLKSFAIPQLLSSTVPLIDGFAASSLNEAFLARDILGDGKSVHITTPGLRSDEIDSIARMCDYVCFNSLSQLERFHGQIDGNCRPGLRVNTELSFVQDDRYNPCRKHSKLGVSLNRLQKILRNGPGQIKNIDGLLFHTNCESENFSQLLEAVILLDTRIPELLDQANWINLGGGYLFDEYTDWSAFLEAVTLCKNKYGLEVFFEPGKGIVGEAGYIISTVLDIFDNDGKKIAVLDTTVNHMPEVFEYQYRPQVMQEYEDGKYEYILAGATCLAGDLFGEYSFDEPLEIGSRIIFENMGAYTLVKAHMFNGVNLPTIYTYSREGKLELIKQFSYDDFKSRCGANVNEAI